MTTVANSSPPEGVQRIQVLDRAAELLRTISVQEQPRTAVELARLCRLNRTTTWRILVTLEHHGLVERDPDNQRYRIGYGITRLGESAGHGPLIRAARPVLQALADRTREQVSLGVPHHFGCTYIDQVQPAIGSPVPRWLGQSGPLHATGSGKVFLTALDPAERRALLGSRLERFTDSTITSHAELERELEAIRGAGFATSAGEHDEATSAVCAGVFGPQGQLAAIVDVWGPAQRLPRERLRELGPELRRAADELAARLA